MTKLSKSDQLLRQEVLGWKFMMRIVNQRHSSKIDLVPLDHQTILIVRKKPLLLAQFKLQLPW